MEYFISVVRDNYINFDGRARRKEFWTFHLFSYIFTIFALFVDSSLGLTDTIGFNIIYTLITPLQGVETNVLNDYLIIGLLVYLLVAWLTC